MLKRLLKFVTLLLIMPGIVIAGALVSSGRLYYFIACALVLLALVPFFAAFEKGKGSSKHIVVVAVACALSVAGRMLFAELPSFKPVSALLIICALYFGAETGFLTGALTAIISNIYFGQGPWTPFQMLAWGLVGFFAGIFAAQLKKHLWLLLIYGLAAGVGYSLFLDIYTVLWVDGGFNFSRYIAVAVSSLPVTLVYCASNLVFLLILARPAGKKLERIKLKYGM